MTDARTLTSPANGTHGGRPKGRLAPTCRRGHPFTPENTVEYGYRRACRVCQRIRDDARRERRDQD